MNKRFELNITQSVLALAAGLAMTSLNGHAQGIVASGELTGTPGAGGTYDYTLTISNATSAADSIEGIWYAWIPGHFFLPAQPSSASGGTSGWTATVDGDSIQFQGNAGDAIAPGGSATFTFVTTSTPAALAGDSGSFPIGDSYAYPGTISFSTPSPDEEFTVQSTPEPSAAALFAGGALGMAIFGRRWLAKRHLAAATLTGAA